MVDDGLVLPLAVVVDEFRFDACMLPPQAESPRAQKQTSMVSTSILPRSARRRTSRKAGSNIAAARAMPPPLRSGGVSAAEFERAVMVSVDVALGVPAAMEAGEKLQESFAGRLAHANETGALSVPVCVTVTVVVVLWPLCTLTEVGLVAIVKSGAGGGGITVKATALLETPLTDTAMVPVAAVLGTGTTIEVLLQLVTV